MMRIAMPVALLLVAVAVAVAADKEPATEAPAPKKPAAGHVSPMIVKQVNEVPRLLCGQKKTTLAKMEETLNEIFFPLMEEAEKKKVHVQNPVYFVYDGASDDPSKPFQLATGFTVHEDVKPFGNYKIRKLAKYRCATVYYTGPLDGIGTAYEKLYGSLAKAGHTPTGHRRELYLFWDGEDSPNTIVELQVGIK